MFSDYINKATKKTLKSFINQFFVDYTNKNSHTNQNNKNIYRKEVMDEIVRLFIARDNYFVTELDLRNEQNGQTQELEEEQDDDDNEEEKRGEETNYNLYFVIQSFCKRYFLLRYNISFISPSLCLSNSFVGIHLFSKFLSTCSRQRPKPPIHLIKRRYKER